MQTIKTGFFLIVVLSLFISQRAVAQDAAFDDSGVAREMLLDESIRTIQLYREGWINSYPIMTMDSDVPLVLEFDELTGDVNLFSYMVIHCDADWTQSDLYDQEYMIGFFENQIDDARTSFNTYYNYTHFQLSLPNNDISFTRSGNYLLVVFRDYDREEIVFTRRFMISEAAVGIEAKANRPVLTSYRDCCHEIDITVNTAGYRIDDPFSETTLSMYQNGVWDYEIKGLKPLFINPGELVYDYQQENVFDAGNEFRMFDTKNTTVRSYYVQNIEYVSPYFHFELKPEEANKAYLYFDREDMNGKFFVESSEGLESAVDADYVFVHFTLKMALPLADGDVYIGGGLSNWQFTESNKMRYDVASSAYRGTLLLKQGIYNYRYMFLPQNEESFDVTEIEGSHYETENEYLILFYHRGPGKRYDKLVGHQVIHSQ